MPDAQCALATAQGSAAKAWCCQVKKQWLQALRNVQGNQGKLVCRYLFMRSDNEPAPWASDGMLLLSICDQWLQACSTCIVACRSPPGLQYVQDALARVPLLSVDSQCSIHPAALRHRAPDIVHHDSKSGPPAQVAGLSKGSKSCWHGPTRGGVPSFEPKT